MANLSRSMHFFLQELDDNLAKLKKNFEEATEDKLRCQQQAESTAITITLANRYPQPPTVNRVEPLYYFGTSQFCPE